LAFGFKFVAHFGGSLRKDPVMDGEESQFQAVADPGLVVN
jgi:hypothetical protein